MGGQLSVNQASYAPKNSNNPYVWLSRILILSSVGAAVAAFFLPAKVGELAGIASILTLAALASTTGHRWGMAVVLTANAGLAGNIWPFVENIDTFGRQYSLASVGIILTLPGLIALLFQLPRLVDQWLALNGRNRRIAHSLAFVGLAAWLVAPTLSKYQSNRHQSSPIASVKPDANAVVSTSVPTSMDTAPPVASKRFPLTSPNSSKVTAAAWTASRTQAACSGE